LKENNAWTFRLASVREGVRKRGDIDARENFYQTRVLRVIESSALSASRIDWWQKSSGFRVAD